MSDGFFEQIVIGAGAAGLYYGALASNKTSGLIIEKMHSPGNKFLISGAGSANITHGGNIKEFVNHYGNHGTKIRSILYKHNNQNLMDFFQSKGINLVIRDDGKVFPDSMKAKDIVDVLIDASLTNKFTFHFDEQVVDISYNANEKSHQGENEKLHRNANPFWKVQTTKSIYTTEKLVIAAGGCSYPATGSDGSIFKILRSLDIMVTPLRPALAPVFVKEYLYTELSGISFSDVHISIADKHSNKSIASRIDDLLLTHKGFSGPVILNASRYIDLSKDVSLSINYLNSSAEEVYKELKDRISNNKKQIITILEDFTKMPKRFLTCICQRADVEKETLGSNLSNRKLKAIVALLVKDLYDVKDIGGNNIAMVTSGGVSLEEIELRNMASKKYPGLYFLGEMVDVDGDTGGYNLQFAYSSAAACAGCTL